MTVLGLCWDCAVADWCLQSDPVPVHVPDSCLQVDAIDLNLGCPQRIAHSGRFGSYLLKDDEHEVVFAMVRALSKALKVPVFCKIRLLETVAKTVAFCARASKLFWSCLSSPPPSPPPPRAPALRAAHLFTKCVQPVPMTGLGPRC